MFSGVVEWSIRSRELILALVVVLLFVGLREVQQLPIDVLPDLTRPTVMVQAEAPGLAPEDIEPQVTYPIEVALSGVPDVQRVRSVSSLGLTVVYAEFAWGSDPYRDRQFVAERLETLRGQLPNGVEPRIGPLTSLMGEILLLSLTAEHESLAPMALREMADWVVRPVLLSIPGVAQVIPIGGDVRQYEIQPDPARLRLLNVPLNNLMQAVRGFGRNQGDGFADSGGREVVIRTLGLPFHLEDLAQIGVPTRNGTVMRLHQVADLAVGARIKRGEASVDGHPAVILSVQKQPGADTVQLTRLIETRLAQLGGGLPEGVRLGTVFRQADFIGESVANVRTALLDGALIVAIVLSMFLVNRRALGIVITAIPLSLIAAIVLLSVLGESINTMTLGGLAIAVGELIDDAVIGVENVLRRVRTEPATSTATPMQVIARATLEVRSGVFYATLIIVLVFLPLFALGGMEGHLFAPLGIAYIAAILASLVVALTLIPVLCVFAFTKASAVVKGERRWLEPFKARYTAALGHVLDRSTPYFVVAAGLVLLAAVATAILPRTFLPPFNEDTLTINLILEPGVSLVESDRLGRIAENLLLQVPEVLRVGRRTGRGELDEHAEGVNYSEIDVALKFGSRSRDQIIADVRSRLSGLPASLSIGAPISHRLDHLLSGVQAPLVFKVIGEDLPTLRRLATTVRGQLLGIPGLADVQLEKQVDVPQERVLIDSRAAAQYGVSPTAVQDVLSQLTVGQTVSEILERGRRFDLVVRLPEAKRTPAALADLLVDTPAGVVPMNWIAKLEMGGGPNQILREDLQRRLVVAAFPDRKSGAPDFNAASAKARDVISKLILPSGYEIHAEGEQVAQQQTLTRIGGLALLSFLLMTAVLYSRYRSLTLSFIVLGNVPFALIGGVAALWWTSTPLSVASVVGFVTLTGVAARNGILKISHFINLACHEGEVFGHDLVLRGSRERLTPVLMTALIAALALVPLLIDGGAPGKEILHPVALVIFGGLISSTLLDSFLTPALFLRFGKESLSRLLAQGGKSLAF